MSERDWPEIVRLLRAKAARTTFPEEAESLTARADALAEKYCVAEPTGAPAQPTAEEQRWIDEWMASARFEQWAQQVAVQRARAWGFTPGAGTATTSQSADGIVITFQFR